MQVAPPQGGQTPRHRTSNPGRTIYFPHRNVLTCLCRCQRLCVGLCLCVGAVSLCTCKWKCTSAGVNRGFKNPGKALLLKTRKITRTHSRAQMQKAAPPRPPTLMTERRKEIKQSPLLCVDVNLGDGQVGEGKKRKSESRRISPQMREMGVQWAYSDARNGRAVGVCMLVHTQN
jgi:hypothetical protein